MRLAKLVGRILFSSTFNQAGESRIPQWKSKCLQLMQARSSSCEDEHTLNGKFHLVLVEPDYKHALDNRSDPFCVAFSAFHKIHHIQVLDFGKLNLLNNAPTRKSSELT